MISWQDIRIQFPVLEKYIYLNPAGGSPMSVMAAEAGKRYFDEMVAEGDVPYDRWMERTEEVRVKLATLLNAGSDEIGFTVNTSSAMGMVALMLKGEGEVLTMKDEFPSSTIPWINLGYKVQFVEPVNHGYPVSHIERQITPETRILVSSAVQYCTGFRQDLEALGKLCRKHKLHFVVNATQAIGVMPVDVRKAGIDFMAFSGLKWTTSGYGAGVVFVSRKMAEIFPFPVAGWQSVENPNVMNNSEWTLRKSASVLEAGCPHFPSIFALGGALDLILNTGPKEIHERVTGLNRLLQQKLLQQGFPVITFDEEKNRSGITIIKTAHAKAIKEHLLKKNIFVAARGEGIRVSVSFFNNEADIDIFMDEAMRIRGLF